MNVGSLIKHQDKQALVVRKVASRSLFEDHTGRCYFVDEVYFELITEEGFITFVNESCEMEQTQKEGKIRGLDPQIWRPRNVTEIQTDRT